MAKIKITKRSVEALKVTSKDYIAFDTDIPGFGVRVMPSGKRFFLVQYRRHGRTRRVMIGQFGVVTAELARREATIKLALDLGVSLTYTAEMDGEDGLTKLISEALNGRRGEQTRPGSSPTVAKSCSSRSRPWPPSARWRSAPRVWRAAKP